MTLYIVGFDDLVTSFVSTIATGWSEPLPAGTASHWETAPLRQTPLVGLSLHHDGSGKDSIFAAWRIAFDFT
jgi:hypothetical protein